MGVSSHCALSQVDGLNGCESRKTKKNEINCNLLKTNLSWLAQDIVSPIVGGGSRRIPQALK